MFAVVLYAALIYAVYAFYNPSIHEYTYIGDDYPSQLPISLPAIQTTLQSGEPGFSLYADDDWATLFPASDGFTDLGTAATTRTFLVSMVHQLHCLDVFRVGFVTNRTGYSHHVEHCLRYMLQIVLCNADTTLEADEAGMRGGRWEHAAGGVGSVHQCRDWRVLREYLDEHAAGPVRL
ncbi:hypothetical protein BD309DRAFT_1015905 [Dichomitus squalens]|uniref:Uncharacterized protein n=1 Tax=Dichomitus squalens TaxID=114155 RepID=A0A4Q9PXW6_9APHY|nr:hypothetical protein BD309DRAFT_1015905 [Dichomitus squalens]TBU59390.1 hypothetical protein BD310DRAFT_976601 [Dichomitus squalens]